VPAHPKRKLKKTRKIVTKTSKERYLYQRYITGTLDYSGNPIGIAHKKKPEHRIKSSNTYVHAS